jgi:hypothetical protein
MMERERLTMAQLPLAAGLFLLIGSWMLFWNFHALGTLLTPEADLAADMLLVDVIRDQGYLWVGHYSRWGFNHPGPFWFYLSYCFEKLFASSDLWRFQIWLWGHLFVSTFLVTAAAIAFSNYLFRRIIFGFVLFFATTLIGFFGLEMTLLWMPWRIVLPYLCFLLAVLHLAEGDRTALWVSVLLTGILVHGYITMPVFTVPLFLSALWMGQRKTGFLTQKMARAHVWGAVALTGLFVLPLVLDALGPAPTNLSRILIAQSGFRAMPKPEFGECLEFAKSLLRLKENRLGWFASLGLLFLVPGWKFISHEHRLRMIRVMVLCGVVSLLVFAYYPRTPSPLYPFVAQFFVVVPLLFLVTMGSLAFQPGISFASGTRQRIWGYLRVLPLLLLSAALFSNLQRPGPGSHGEVVRQLSGALASHSQGHSVSVNLPDPGHWTIMTGLILELARQGIAACTPNRALERIVTPQHVCPADRFPDVELIRKEMCQENCIAESGDYGIRPFRMAVTNLMAPLGSLVDDPGFINWSRSPESTWWSNTRVSQILLNIPNPEVLKGSLELNLHPLWPQRVKVLWNGHEIFNKRLGMVSESLQLTFSPDWIHSGGNVISFVLPGARQPGNGDQRELAIIVDSILIR